MSEGIRYVGLDEHAATIAVSIAEDGRDGRVWYRGQIPNTIEAVRKLFSKLGPVDKLRVVYEAGPCGFGLYWLLHSLGVDCTVAAPTLIPKKSGEMVKTDRLDSLKLAQCHRDGQLTPIWIPPREHEAFRSLVRARQAAKEDQTRHRNQLTKFLLRQRKRKPKGMNNWTVKHHQWLNSLQFEYETDQVVFQDYLHEVQHCECRVADLEKAVEVAVQALPEMHQEVIRELQAMRGVALITAATMVAEVGVFSRFDHPSKLMGYSGLVPSEYSTGGPGKKRQGRITKTGSRIIRRILGETAWHNRHRPAVSIVLKRRQREVSKQSKDIAWAAQKRLSRRFIHLTLKGKEKNKVATAMARETLGFMWDIATRVEQKYWASTDHHEEQ